MDNGQLYLILGPMFSGKTSRLIEKIRKYNFNSKNIVIVKFRKDFNTKDNELITHDNVKYKCLCCSCLIEKLEDLKKYDVVGIDDGHLFKDLPDIAEYLAATGKIVIVSALNADYKMEPFDNISKIIPKVDKIKLLKAFCFYCHKDATCSLKINDSTDKNENENSYKPLCRNCYRFFNNFKIFLNEEESKEKDAKKNFKKELKDGGKRIKEIKEQQITLKEDKKAELLKEEEKKIDKEEAIEKSKEDIKLPKGEDVTDEEIAKGLLFV